MRSLVFTCSEDLATLLAPLEAGIPVELRVQPKSKELRSHDILLGNNEGLRIAWSCALKGRAREHGLSMPSRSLQRPNSPLRARWMHRTRLCFARITKMLCGDNCTLVVAMEGPRNLLLGMAFPQALDPALEKVAQSIAVPKVVVTLPKVVLGDRGRLRNPSFAFEVWLKKHAEQCASIITKVSGKNKKKEKFYVYKNVVGQSYISHRINAPGKGGKADREKLL